MSAPAAVRERTSKRLPNEEFITTIVRYNNDDMNVVLSVRAVCLCRSDAQEKGRPREAEATGQRKLRQENRGFKMRASTVDCAPPPPLRFPYFLCNRATVNEQFSDPFSSIIRLPVPASTVRPPTRHTVARNQFSIQRDRSRKIRLRSAPHRKRKRTDNLA